MTELLIVYHSRTGGSRQMAQAAADAARGECGVSLRTADAAGPEDLLRADGYLFCGPENLAALSGLMKEFFDRCYYPVLGRIEGRPYAQMICAGSDGAGAARQLARIATGWRLKEVQPPLIVCTHAQKLVEQGGGDVFGDQQRANAAFLGLNDHAFQKIRLVFVKIVDGDGDKFEMFGFGLVKEGQRIRKAQVAPLVAHDFFHVDYQQIKVLYVPTDRAGQDRVRISLDFQTTRHCHFP